MARYLATRSVQQSPAARHREVYGPPIGRLETLDHGRGRPGHLQPVLVKGGGHEGAVRANIEQMTGLRVTSHHALCYLAHLARGEISHVNDACGQIRAERQREQNAHAIRQDIHPTVPAT